MEYEKPTIKKQEKMTFMYESYKCYNKNKCGKEKQDIDCPTTCIHHAQMGCRQCSSCHACR